jgi:hypothetical protein
VILHRHRRLLRPRRERPSSHRSCNACDEIAPSHCLSSGFQFRLQALMVRQLHPQHPTRFQATGAVGNGPTTAVSRCSIIWCIVVDLFDHRLGAQQERFRNL